MQNALLKSKDDLLVHPETSDPPISLRAKIEVFKQFEDQCEEATEALEQFAKDVTNRVMAASSSKDEVIDSDDVILDDDSPDPVSHACDTKSFKRRVELARKFCVPYQTTSGFQFVEGATESELEELELLDVRIRLLQYQMDQTESEILECVPTNAHDALAKLSFVSSLLINGCHLDVDHFAYIVKEATDQCSRDLALMQVRHKRLLNERA